MDSSQLQTLQHKSFTATSVKFYKLYHERKEVLMYYIVVNPASKTGKGLKIWKRLLPILHHKNIPYQVQFTTGLDSATRISHSISSSITSPTTLIVLGGDGTINEVIQGLSNHHLVKIGYIPTGSSNDLARSLKISKNPLLALENIINTPVTSTLDIGRVTYINGYHRLTNAPLTKADNISRLFAVGFGIGFDAAVCEASMNSPIKGFFNGIGLGKLTYLGIGLMQLIKSPSADCELYLDNGHHIKFKKFLFITAMVHPYQGGGFKFCPFADAQDDFLDICVAGNINFRKALMIIPSAFKGKHLRFADVHSYRSKNITIKSSLPLWIHTDGEVNIAANHVQVSSIAKRVQFIH